MPLTATQINLAKPSDKPYKLYDSHGMFLQVSMSGRKYWRMKYRFAGKEKLLAIGVYPEVSLKDARLTRERARKLLIDGIDPSHEKQSKRRISELAAENSFEAVANEYMKVKLEGFSFTHIDRTTRAIKRDLMPALGKRPVSEITAPELLTILRKVEKRGAVETANRIKQVAGQIFRFAIATGRAERDVSVDLKGALKNPKKSHFAAITNPREVVLLMKSIWAYDATPVVSAALRLSPLLFCRPGELRHMEWTEVNWQLRRIELPAEKMKIGEPLVIPLSNQAIQILKDLHPHTGHGKYIFPSARGAGRPMSINAVRLALRSMGYDNETMTPHGFRAMARTLLDEVLGYRVEYIEQQLGHAVKDANGRAYNRTKHLKQRAEMMQRWSDFLVCQ
ncbi:integrase [Aliidiomarina maris]|uniref:Integrase n=2 Tax=Aliidiomarina maris TaxID=531312 RepID=A0A327XBM6_9GAMM|nr:integrase [Aliidiomarina maris]RUO28704.1 integrase [Aliidiomarina maris]